MLLKVSFEHKIAHFLFFKMQLEFFHCYVAEANFSERCNRVNVACISQREN